MKCIICIDLARAFEAGRREYIKARSSVCSEVCINLVAEKNVDMERAKYELEEHRLVCVTAIRALALLPKRDVFTLLRQMAAKYHAGYPRQNSKLAPATRE